MKHFSIGIAATVMMAAVSGVSHGQTPYDEMPAGEYKLDKSHSSLTWKISHLGLSNYTARFTSFDADLTFDSKAPEKSALSVTIDPLSVETDYPYPEKSDFNKKLATSDRYMDGEKFPEISFASTGIENTGESSGTITGELTFRGISKPVTLDAVFNGATLDGTYDKKPTMGFSATGTLDRTLFGMADSSPSLGNEVTLVIEAEFKKTSDEDE